MENAASDHGEFWGIGVFKNSPKIKLPREKESDKNNLRSNARDIEVNEDGTIWISSNIGMIHFSIENGVIERYKTNYKRGLGIIIPDPMM